MKPVKRAIEAYDYHEIADYISQKYNIVLGDVDGMFTYDSNNYKNWWLNKGYPELDEDGKDRNNSQRWYKEYQDDINNRKWEYNKPKYKNFWHLFCDDIHNGSYFYLTTEDDDYSDVPEWAEKIYWLFRQEFGDEIYCYASW